jgi:hypothetical protein
MTKMVADWFAGKEIATAMAIFVNSWPAGIALGLLTLPLIGTAYSVGAVYLAVAALIVFLGCVEISARVISPGAFREKRVPDRDFLIARSSAAFKAPLKNFLIRAAFERSIDKRVVIYAEKSCATRVEHRRIFIDTGKIVRR